MSRFKCVAVGGTFDRLHEGHKALLRKAFQVGDRVIIGVATGRLLRGKIQGELIYPYERRVANLKKFLGSEGYLGRVELIPISDQFGTTADDPRIQALVVSEETASAVKRINEERSKKGLQPLHAVVIKMVLGADGKPIRSTELRELEARRQHKKDPRRPSAAT